MTESKLIHLCKNKKIYIYGAGMVGELALKRLSDKGITIKGFAVTKRSESNVTYLNHPVYEIEELVEEKDDVVILVATLPNFHKEMLATLKEYGFSNIIKVGKALYQDMSQQYINQFLSNQKQNTEQVDIIFMASDNNSSSGAFLSMVDLCCEYEKQNVKSMVVLPEYGNGEKILIEKSVRYTYIPSEHWVIPIKSRYGIEKKKKISQNDKAVEELQRIIRDSQAKLVHNNTIYTYIGSLAAQKEGIKCIWHIREDIKNQQGKFIEKEKVIKQINSVDKIILISNFMKKCMKGLDEKKEVVIYDCIDVDNYYIEKNILSDESKVTIAVVGVVTARKGQEDIIRAAKIVKSRGYFNFCIKLVGNEDPKYAQKLKKIINDLNLNEEIIFTGRQNNMKAVYSEVDIVAICSKEEPLGRATIEGQLSGSLVIGSNSGATPELIEDGETGYLYTLGKAEELADCIIKAITDIEKSREIAKKGQEKSYLNFSKEKKAREVIKVYEDLLGVKFDKKGLI